MFMPCLTFIGIELNAPNPNALVLEQYLVSNRTKFWSAR